MKRVKLKLTDDKIIEVDRKAVRFSTTILDCIEIFELSHNGDAMKEPLPVTCGNEKVIKKLMEWCEEHKDDETSTYFRFREGGATQKNGYIQTEWDRRYLDKIDGSFLIDLIVAADYLGMKELFSIFASKAAQHLQGKTVKEMEKYFLVVSDMNAAEERAIQKQNDEWVQYLLPK